MRLEYLLLRVEHPARGANANVSVRCTSDVVERLVFSSFYLSSLVFLSNGNVITDRFVGEGQFSGSGFESRIICYFGFRMLAGYNFRIIFAAPEKKPRFLSRLKFFERLD